MKKIQPLLSEPRITKEELEKFKEIILKDYGKELSDPEATEQATALLNFFDYFIDKRHKEKTLSR
ncbi:MAG: hypothetical protein HZA34_04405 [Candidatus Pacebacteria bacterium]|nr:hypothetical protein [Candidatus Paceibacterota bacterium]